MTSPFLKYMTCPRCLGLGLELVEYEDGTRAIDTCPLCDGLKEITADVYHDYIDG